MEKYGTIIFMKLKMFSKKANVNFALAIEDIVPIIGYNEDELQVAIETCDYIVKNISSVLKSERGIVWPYDFFDYWSGKSMLEHGNANPFIVGKILSLYMLKNGIYIYTTEGRLVKEWELIISEPNLNYYITAPKYF